MGTLTLTELKDEVKRGLGNRDDMDSRLVRFINLAQVKMARHHSFEELETVTTSTLGFTGTPATDKFLAVPANLRKIHSFRIFSDSQSRKLIYTPIRRWDRQIPLPEWYAVGKPSLYTKWNDKLEMWKVPDAAYSYEIRHKNWPSAMSDASPNATSDFDQKDDIIIYLALSWANASIGKLDKAQRFWGFYRKAMNDALGEDSVEPDMDILPGKGVTAEGRILDSYWSDPFIRSMP